MKSLSSQEDIQSTRKAMESAPQWFLGIPDKKTPWYFLSLDYADGYVHWYDVGSGPRRIVCVGGLEGKGFAVNDCPICGYVRELYQESKRLKEEEGDEAKSKQLKDRANRLHARPEVQFKAIRGQRTLMKTKAGKEWIADWDTEDEDSTVGVGIISLSESQFDGLTGLIEGENTPFIENGDGLGTRVLWSSKEKRKGRSGGKYSAVVWDADEDESEMPELEVEKELLELDLTDNFKTDEEEIETVYSALSGQELEEPEEDEEVELDEDSEEEPDDADLDDLDEDEDPDSEEEETEEEEAEEETAEFVDDDPDDLPPKAKKKGKSTTTTRTTTRTTTAAKKKSTTSAAKKSGTTKTGTKKRSGKAKL
jgi:hypothetical protein